jgi:hypothetical protein
MTRTPAEWRNEQALEARALYALWRNHPLTAVKDRWGERAHRLARANRNMLLSWAATQPDWRLRDCRNIGAATLAWIRDAILAALPSPEPTLDVERLTEAIERVLQDSDTRIGGPYAPLTSPMISVRFDRPAYARAIAAEYAALAATEEPR